MDDIKSWVAETANRYFSSTRKIKSARERIPLTISMDKTARHSQLLSIAFP